MLSRQHINTKFPPIPVDVSFYVMDAPNSRPPRLVDIFIVLNNAKCLFGKPYFNVNISKKVEWFSL